jgi:RHS repeat-associated protein
MPDDREKGDAKNGASAPGDKFFVQAPLLSLPKGGGAIRGIGEKFAANPVTGTGSVSVPIATSPGRSGFGPQLTLSYDSGAGNGPFGFGWSLALPSITRKTDKGLPQYDAAQESDTFILSGSEDLVPQLLEKEGQWVRDVSSRTVYGKQYSIHRYRPRIEGLFARIERWANISDPQDTFWRSISKENITTWYGKTPESRIFDPADPSHIFTWLICESHDDKANVIIYQYKAENSEGVDLSQANERNRTDAARSANRYIKHILYGNDKPYFPDLTAAAPVPLPAGWYFELVFDYGDHDLLAPVPQDASQPWTCRLDPFSTYRPTFEVRTYRLCRRALMFHHFANEPGVGLNCLVRSTDFTHSQTTQPTADPTKPFYSFLLSVTQTGYRRNPDGSYLLKSLPPLEFEYTEAVIDETVREIDPQSLENLPYGLDGTNYRWVDLDGEGLSGILTEQGGSWFYKPNLSPVNQHTENGQQKTIAQFGPTRVVERQPSLAALGSGGQQLLALSGDGQLDLVEFDSPTPGFFERTEDQDWNPFTPFQSLPVLDWRSPNLKFVDVTGDGLSDVLISEDNVFCWHTGLGAEGFGPEQRVPQALDEEKGPKLLFADGTESIFLADLSGDGLTDIMRIRNGEVCYWPNLGYGRFGAKVTMDNAPWLEAPDLFDGRRIRVADIDGSATTDMIYFASSGVHLYFNQSGNGWGERRVLSQFPPVESVSSAAALDLLGNGTACLVWSSPLPANAGQPMRYIDLMGGQKPHLLVRVANNLGAETHVRYAPSTKFYIADELAGTPWLTRIPFQVHVVERVETYDYISRNRFVTRYAYHHGYYDGLEREFRGFGRVDQWDTEEFAALSASSNFPQATNEDTASNVPPVLTKTWFHTGAFFSEVGISRHMQREYYRERDPSRAIAGLTDAQVEAMVLEDTVLPTTILLRDRSRIPYELSTEELREACRALRGSVLRQEVYAPDGTDESHRPYSASQRNYAIEVLQPQGPNKYAVFFAHERESTAFHYERKLYHVDGRELADPRVTHSMVLVVDDYGNELQSVAIAYGRRHDDPDPLLTDPDRANQRALHTTYTESTYTNAILEDDAYRPPLPAEFRTFELINAAPDAHRQDITNLFGFDEMAAKVAAASDGRHDLPYEDLYATAATENHSYRRLIEQVRTLYRNHDLSAGLALGSLESLALPFQKYKLAFTPGLLAVYQRGGENLLPDPASVLRDQGGYVLSDDLKTRGLFPASDPDGHWWVPSGQVFYSPNPADSAAQELLNGRANFFLPRRFQDPFGNSATVLYDPYSLLVLETEDALGNKVTANERALDGTITNRNDYRVLQPALLTDPNGNRSQAVFDGLGLVAGTAVKGKTPQNLGDSLAGFTTDLLQQDIDQFFANPSGSSAATLLGNATSRIVYDLGRFARITSTPTPAFAATIARETHGSDLAQGQGSNLQVSFSYSDGFGREIQKKIQAEPGAVPKRDADGGIVVGADGRPVTSANDSRPRWVGSDWTVFNNKGKPVRQYEPFFTDTHRFEFDLRIGVSPLLFYDPLGRVVGTLHPMHSWEKVVFDPWRQETWDVNDTVLVPDPKNDVNVGDFFGRLPDANYLPTWHAARQGGALGAEEQDATRKAAIHAATPAAAYADSLGRTFLTVASNKFKYSDTPPATPPVHEFYCTRVILDIQGNQRELIDAKERILMRYEYDMLRNRVHQASMEAGERWVLNDVVGKPLYAWDSRNHRFRTAYDPLRRPTDSFLRQSAGAELLVGRNTYGEAGPSPESSNLRGRVHQVFDQAGVVTNGEYDFKGNLIYSQRRFASDYKTILDWSAAVLLEGETYTSRTRYDALNRPTQLIAPHSDQGGVTVSVIQPIYNEANLLKQLHAWLNQNTEPTRWLDPNTADLHAVTHADYNAKGQQELIEYGNGVSTKYEYDGQRFHLIHMKTTRAADHATLQDLRYTYDPAGNITHILDDAQQTIYFRNKRVEPSADYTYDAAYRLIEATGREHLGQNGTPISHSYNDVPCVSLLHPGDGNAMGTYIERYSYDAVGNFVTAQHRGSDPVNSGWTRTYTYREVSLLEPDKSSNRLSNSSIGNNNPTLERYAYDAHGSMLGMSHLQVMQWDFKDQLQMTQRQAVNADDADGLKHLGERTWYVYDSTGRRVRKVTELSTGLVNEERLYLGGFEIYRKQHANGLVRQTVHIVPAPTQAVDDKQPIVLVETRTQGSDPAPRQLIRYQFGNHLGSACLELDEQGRVISYEEYMPYGSTSYEAVRSQTETPRRYRYTGKERDEETGLYYNGSRYYAPWFGRWSSCDKGGLTNSANGYEYVRGNPIRLTDPNGRWGVDMHFAAVYWTGRLAGVSHEEALKAAIASQSLDDFEQTAAPQMKENATLAPPTPGRFQMNLANNSHALAITKEESGFVANFGIHTSNILVFGQGLHTVGDYLPHANLSGNPSFGHQAGINEDYSVSTPWLTDADKTSKNPQKALATFERFREMWWEFRQSKEGLAGPMAPLTEDQLKQLSAFIYARNWQEMSSAFHEALAKAGVSTEEIQDVEKYLQGETDKSGKYTSGQEMRKAKWTEILKTEAGAKAVLTAGNLWEVIKGGHNSNLWNSTKVDITEDLKSLPAMPVDPRFEQERQRNKQQYALRQDLNKRGFL